MKWTYDNYRHYSSEHMQKAEKARIAKELEKNILPPRKGVLGRRRDNRHTL